MTNSKNTKRALLASILSVVLCCAMLIGSTFAWFTDSDSTAVNKIQAGTLDVALEMKDASGNWVTAEGQTLNWKKAAGATADEAVLWEPGCTYELPELRIRNNGSLALKYKLVVTGIVGDAKLLEAIDFTYGNGIDLNAEEHLKAKETSSALTIKGHMKETAGNEYQGLSIDGIGITVVATQDAVEYDSSGNQYDVQAAYPDVWDGTISSDVTFTGGKATVSTAADFAGAAKKAAENTSGDITIDLQSDLDLRNADWDSIGVDGYHGAGVLTIEGNGKTLYGLNAPLVAGGFAGNSGVVIKNLTIADSNIPATAQGTGAFIACIDSMPTIILENCHVKNTTIAGERVGGLIGWTSGYNNPNDGPVDTYVTITNCSVEDCTINSTKSAGGIIGHAGANPATFHTISGCTVKNVTFNGLYNGQLIGTANVGQVTASGNTLSGNSASHFVGRYALGSTGSVTIDGTKYTTE